MGPRPHISDITFIFYHKKITILCKNYADSEYRIFRMFRGYFFRFYLQETFFLTIFTSHSHIIFTPILEITSVDPKNQNSFFFSSHMIPNTPKHKTKTMKKNHKMCLSGHRPQKFVKSQKSISRTDFHFLARTDFSPPTIVL